MLCFTFQIVSFSLYNFFNYCDWLFIKRLFKSKNDDDMWKSFLNHKCPDKIILGPSVQVSVVNYNAEFIVVIIRRSILLPNQLARRLT